MPHIHKDIDYAVDVYVVHEGMVLLRMHDKYHFWSVPGGHVELDEDPNQAALREVWEEVGLEVELIGAMPPVTEGGEYRELLPPRYMNVHAIDDTHRHIALVYFARAKGREVTQTIEREKSSDIRWVTEVELDDPALGLKETIRFYAKAALAAASGSPSR